MTLPLPVSSCSEPCQQSPGAEPRLRLSSPEPPSAGRATNFSVSPPFHPPTNPHLPPPHPLACLQRETEKASLTRLPDCFCSCEQTNRVWPLTKENAGAHLILLPQGVAWPEGLVIGKLQCSSSCVVRESQPDSFLDRRKAISRMARRTLLEHIHQYCGVIGLHHIQFRSRSSFTC